MGDVRQLFRQNSLAPDAESQARYLESLAADIRSGDVTISVACLVYTDRELSSNVHYLPFGRPTNYMELVGLLEYAKAAVLAPDR